MALSTEFDHYLNLDSRKRITAMGLGRFGGQLAAIRHLAPQVDQVIVTDTASNTSLEDAVRSLNDFDNIQFKFGPHEIEDFLETDLILVSPAVPPRSPFLRQAESNGIPIITEMELFLYQTQAAIIAVTGTIGKSTTSAMIHHLLKCNGIQSHLGGNIGNSLLPELDQLTPDIWVVLELSSFQLHWLRRWNPKFSISVLTNIFPHHLDWHEDFDEYRHCKMSILELNHPECTCVVPADFIADLADSNLNQTLTFGLPLPDCRDGVFLVDSKTPAYQVINKGRTNEIPMPDELREWPRHQLLNACAALSVAQQFEPDHALLLHQLSSYPGLPHRFQSLGMIHDRIWINDSKATSPQATHSAITTLKSPTHLIIGGSSSADDLDQLIKTISVHPFIKSATSIGERGPEIHSMLKQSSPIFRVNLCSSLEVAVETCLEYSFPGETILLSPACPSHDQFLHYEDRGQQFEQIIKQQVHHQ